MAPDQRMSNHEVENEAIRFVLECEWAAGRKAVDARYGGAMVDIEGDHLIEVKAYGGSARGAALWLETRQVEAALQNPERFHLVVVEHVRSGQPRSIDIHGPTLAALLERRREKRYFEVPFPTGAYDQLLKRSTDPD